MINSGCVNLRNVFFFVCFVVVVVFLPFLTHLSPFNPKQCLRRQKQQEGHLFMLLILQNEI